MRSRKMHTPLTENISLKRIVNRSRLLDMQSEREREVIQYAAFIHSLCTMHHTPARIHIYCAPLAVRDTVYIAAHVYIS